MKNFFTQAAASAIDSIGPLPKAKARQGRLYVAYLNTAMIDRNAAGDFSNEDKNGTPDHKKSVFSTTGGAYYINGVPAILSQEEEMMLYEDGFYEYN